MAGRKKQKPDKVDQNKIDKALENWAAFCKQMSSLNEAEVEKALEQESAGKKRKQFLTRLHARLSSLRKKRERAALFGG